ncbi:hypothetical protein J3B02_006016 [Coemansia erecta]|nr:hypothetical protein J3B02_006016 [Coemansia erecta]
MPTEKTMQALNAPATGLMQEITKPWSDSLAPQGVMNEEDETPLMEQMIVEQFMEECHDEIMEEDCPLTDLSDTEEQTEEEYDKTSSTSRHEEVDRAEQQEMLMEQYANALEEMMDKCGSSREGLNKEFVAKLIKHIAVKGVLEIAEMLEKQETKAI